MTRPSLASAKIITAGKSYLDVRQALDDLGIDEALAAQIGIRLFKVGMVWPLEAEGVRRFADGLDEILVVEEKRQLPRIPAQRRALQLARGRAPAGDRKVRRERRMGDDPEGRRQGRSRRMAFARCRGAYSGDDRAGDRRAHRALLHLGPHQARLAFLETKEQALARRAFRSTGYRPSVPDVRTTPPPMCRSSRAWQHATTWRCGWTAAPSASRRWAAKGVPWVSRSPPKQHVFASLGDGTYFHSGLLAIRQSVAARVNITCKISTTTPWR